MSWRNVKLLFRREVRDQVRDRRTLFMIAVLPILFYPLLGVCFFQIAQFLREHPSPVLIVGAQRTKALEELIHDRHFSSRFLGGSDAHMFKLEFPKGPMPWEKQNRPPSKSELASLMRDGRYDAVLYFPPGFADRLERYPEELRDFAQRGGKGVPPEIPRPEVIGNTSQDKTALAHSRLERVLTRWSEDVGRQALIESNMPENAARPIEFRSTDLAVGAEGIRIDTSLWSKVLPFVMLIWALTGAFYPAVDLCAGEKERGTLETLLSSPAQRSEIVMGKLLTVMVFSVATAGLNLASMGITGTVVMRQLGEMSRLANVGPPPVWETIWLGVVLLPVAALFSAVCLALAAFARSTKEGQYYLMPVILVAMPLILVPMTPSAELNLGNSLVPVSGIVLLMRSIMEGTFYRLWPFAIPVAIVTLGCFWMAVRWAIDQFTSETVLFREGEQWDFGIWMRHLVRDREAIPNVAMAALCAALILVIRFFMTLIMAGVDAFSLDFITFARIQVALQIAAVLAPALLMTIFLTRSPRSTLRLDRPRLSTLGAAALLALALHPLIIALQLGISQLYELAPNARAFNEHFTQQLANSPLWLTMGVIALVPAVCEELAFRGFILSGLRRSGHKWRAILVTAFVFGISHAVFQQSLMAALIGVVLGYLVIQSGTIWPAMVFHFVNNGLLCTMAKMDQWRSASPLFDDFCRWLYGWRVGSLETIQVYSPGVMLLSLLVSAWLLLWFRNLPYERTAEEALQEALEHESAHSLAS